MLPRRIRCNRPAAARAFALAAVLALMGAGVARGDDRDLLRQAVADPYLFIIMDTSGSMNWGPKGASCPTGDCFVPLQADDEGSKFYQAKQALFEVLGDPSFPKVQLGFATYNQDALEVRAKHWLYEATSAGVNIPGWGAFPAIGSREVFGLTWSCDTGNNDHEIGCTAGKPADLSDLWEITRMQRLPKGGVSYSSNVDFYFRHSNTTYRVRYSPSSGSYGSNLTVNVNVLRCTNGSCSSTTSQGSTNVTFKPVSDFLSWDNAGTANPDRSNPNLSYYTSTASDSTAGGTCNGWDPNTDTTTDRSNGYSLRFPTTTDARGSAFAFGDVIPLDWRSGADHREDIMRRLAPNYGSGSPPDFRIATYLADQRFLAEDFLRLKNEARRPLFANGSTPLGASLSAFRTWYNGCTGTGTCAGNNGWVRTASDPATGDASFRCRNKYVLILTDGDETCDGDPCAIANKLRQEGVTVFVVAFGVTKDQGNASNKLNCMADDTHTFYPQDKDELVRDLQTALGQISEDPRAFASAAVPSVQAEVADRIYLSSFRPINDTGTFFWDGHIDAYLKPLPLKDGKPDRDLECPAEGGGEARSSCFLWDAGAVLVGQAPTRSTVDASSPLNAGALRLGLNANERRVFYAKAQTEVGVHRTLRLFAPPASDPDWLDLAAGLKLPTPLNATQLASAKTRMTNIMKDTLAIKEAKITPPGGTEIDVDYVMGDVFHADPVIVDRPNDFAFYSSDLYGTAGSVDCTNNQGYRCFAQNHRRRRKILLVGANDGQLHAFDAGVWRKTPKTFSEGTGTELFSYMPRIGLPILRDQTEGKRQIFGVDGTPRVDEVFIHPDHKGAPDSTKREWRTVAVGGFREGGFRDGGGRVTDFFGGYYALDITQPDKLSTEDEPIDERIVPSCMALNSSLESQKASGCGTLPYPAVLWEFTDTLFGSRMDEDRNTFPDIGQTWSVPTIGRIRVLEDTGSGQKEVDKFVAIFGGGMDAEKKSSPQRGTWLYMLDIETGETIYKRPLVGAAPSDPAVLDTDLDGYLDTVYIGTTAGFLYKVDISTRGRLENYRIRRDQVLPNFASDVDVLRITDASWEPFAIFDTIGKPIYLPPTLFYVARLNRYALAFGTGDREALWDNSNTDGRFYMIIDENFKAGMTPKSDTDYQGIDIGDASAPDADYVLNPPAGQSRGWYMRLPEEERVITQAFGLSGVVIFSSFQPDPGSAARPCARGGNSHIFVVYANNANGVMTSGGAPIRFRTVSHFVTSPYVEQGSTKNTPGETPTPNSEDLDATQKEILSELKKFYPKGTKFANYWISISGVRSDTGYERYATIPVGIIERNWKEY